MNEIVTETEYGRVQGLADSGVLRFGCVPYAAPPVGERRFQPPVCPTRWTGTRDVSAPGPIPPQAPSRLARVLGDYDLVQSEDCLSLNIVTPALEGARRPVLVWLYGGAFVSGGNAIPWYDGAQFAREHGLVFVGVNYRLGALGFLNIEGVSPGNVAIRDQIAALAWVQRNISQFGGDPGQVTLVGQSAGAISAFSLLAAPSAQGLFQRVILQSGRFNSLATAAQSQAAGAEMLSLADVPAEDFRRLPLPRILELQGQSIRSNAAFALTSTPFRPFADGELIPIDTLGAAVRQARGKAIMLGWTRDELAAFFANNEAIVSGNSAAVEEAFQRNWGPNWEAGMAFAAARQPGAPQDRFLDLGLNECTFAGSAVLFAEHLAAVAPAWLYRFDWSGPASPFGACHCIELPFVFNNLGNWQAPMLAGTKMEQAQALAREMHATWARFVHTGTPSDASLPAWPRYDQKQRWTMRIDDIFETVSDLAGVSLPGRPWPENLPLPG